MAVIGLSVVEREVADTPVIVPPPLGQTGAVFQSERGPVGVAVQLDSLADAKQVFGEPNKNYNSFFCLRGLFTNAGEGGARVYGVRVTPVGTAGATPASRTSTVDPAYVLNSGDSLTVTVDAHGPTTATFTAGAAVVTGSGTFPATFAGESFSFKVNDGPTVAVTFGSGSLTLADVLATINALGVGFSAVANSGHVRLQSDKKGTSAKLEILAGGSALTLLGMTAGVTNGTGNVTNISAVTALEVKTIIEAAMTDAHVTVLGTGRFKLTGTVTGAAGQLVFGTGTALSPLGLPASTTVNGVNATLSGPSPASTTFKRSATNVWLFGAGFRGHEDPGAWANGRVFVNIKAAASDPTRRDVEIWYKGPRDTAASRKEAFESLAADNVVQTINHPTRGSMYVTVAIVGGDVGVPDVTSLMVDLSTDTAGSNGVAVPTEDDYASALEALGGLPIQLVVNFDNEDATWAGHLEDYCSVRGDVLGIGQTLRGETISGLNAEFATILKPKSFVALYRSYAKVSDTLGGTIAVPIVGHVIGAGYVRKPRAAGNLPHVAPAGILTSLLDVEDVEDSVYSAAQLTTLLDGSNINPIVFEPGQGFFIKTSRTMSTLLKHVSAHVRILTNFLKVAFRKNLSSFEQEPNNETTRRRLKTGVENFMKTYYAKGSFETFGGFANNVSVVCDAGNNPQSMVQQRILTLGCRFRPSEISETVDIQLVQSRDAIISDEV